MIPLKELLKCEIFDRNGRIRYYSGFNIDGFFKGYSEGRFDKSAMSREKHVWFYVGDKLISHYPLDGPIHDIGTDMDYLLYFLTNFVWKKGRAIKHAAGSAKSREGSRSIPDYEPCVFSGRILVEEITNPGAAPSWYASRDSIVPVDRLYKVTKTGRIVDISDGLIL